MGEQSGLSARRAAFKALSKIIGEGRSLDETTSFFQDLSPQDQGFARALTLCVLRYYGPLSAHMRGLSDTGKKIKPLSLNILACMGAAQMAYMAVADHAAVDTSIKLAQKSGLNRQKGFLNALLRKHQKAQKEIIISAKTAHYPDWMVKSWQSHYGKEETDNMIAALMSEAPLDITCPDAGKRAALHATYSDQSSLIGHHTLRFHGAHRDVTAIKGYDEGYWWVQDAASAYPVSSLIETHSMPKPWADMNILDICAAPGGKTMQLAGTGAHVTALDISAKRLERLFENANRTQLQDRITIIQDNALNHHGSYDLILLDAPCTATGTLRRHPDAAFCKTREQMNDLSKLQTSMLEHALNLLNPNGFLLFCTCSLQPEEGEYIARDFAKNNQERLTQHPLMQGVKNQEKHTDKKGFFRSTPSAPPLWADGFFAALYQKK